MRLNPTIFISMNESHDNLVIFCAATVGMTSSNGIDPVPEVGYFCDENKSFSLKEIINE